MASADRFPAFIARVLAAEGGFTANRLDSGNWTGGHVGIGRLVGTKFGIAANTYPDLDIMNLTREQAIEIYRRDFWQPAGCDRMPPVLAYQLLDAAVQHGIRNAKRMLQRAVGVLDDGNLGVKSWTAIQACPGDDLAVRFIAERIRFYASLASWPEFGRGWMLRMAGLLYYVAEDN